MSPLIKQATEHWQFVSPLLAKPETEEDYDARVEYLDELLALVGEDQGHPLASLVIHVADQIEAYDYQHRPIAPVDGVEMLRFLMEQHRLKQSDIPEIGAQSIVSEVLNGKRKLNLRQIRALAQRFKVPMEVFV
jgi:HTH-type transcriptional regulator/antitoxin HigA